MRVYFYHTQDIQYILRRMKQGEFPPHFLYGATLLQRHGIDVVWHRSRLGQPRWRMMLRTAREMLCHYGEYDAVFATHYLGLELIVLLRALRLFRKPIVVWHHQPVITPKQRWREWLGRLFYKGFDELFFFSEKLVSDSRHSTKVAHNKMHVGHWGADLPFYDRVMAQEPEVKRVGFISTGKELRDMPTLVEAFNREGLPLQIHVNRRQADHSYEEEFARMNLQPNIKVHFHSSLIPYELACEVNRAACVVICCQKSKYTVGLTTVVEALALGLPIICSRNPQIPVDLEAEGCGLWVDYGDVKGWQRAIRYIADHPEEALAMGRNARRLAETIFNNEHCAQEVATVLKALHEESVSHKLG